jgi:hypothetical protein
VSVGKKTCFGKTTFQNVPLPRNKILYMLQHSCFVFEKLWDWNSTSEANTGIVAWNRLRPFPSVLSPTRHSQLSSTSTPYHLSNLTNTLYIVLKTVPIRRQRFNNYKILNWWLGNKNSPTVTHACGKRRLKWVATPPLGNINTEAWSSGMGVRRGDTTLLCKKENCWEASKKLPGFCGGGQGLSWAVEPRKERY